MSNFLKVDKTNNTPIAVTTQYQTLLTHEMEEGTQGYCNILIGLSAPYTTLVSARIKVVNSPSTYLHLVEFEAALISVQDFCIPIELPLCDNFEVEIKSTSPITITKTVLTLL